jgi:hypothetical protein
VSGQGLDEPRVDLIEGPLVVPDERLPGAVSGEGGGHGDRGFWPKRVAEFHTPGSFGALFADAASLIDERDVGDAAREAIRRLAEALTTLLAYGQCSGDVNQDIDPSAAAWWVMSLLTARTFRLAIAADPAAVEQQLAEMTMRLTTRPTAP